MQKWVLSFVVFMLTGCASQTSRFSPERVATPIPPEGKGLVVLSTGAPKPCVSTSTWLMLLSDPSVSLEGEVLLSVDAYVLKSDFPDHQGNVHAVLLPAGQYSFVPHIANPYVTPKELPKASFSVGAGEVVYLGEYFMSQACAFQTLAEINDRMERDIALLKARNEKIDTSHVVKRLMQMSGRITF